MDAFLSKQVNLTHLQFSRSALLDDCIRNYILLKLTGSHSLPTKMGGKWFANFIEFYQDKNGKASIREKEKYNSPVKYMRKDLTDRSKNFTKISSISFPS